MADFIKAVEVVKSDVCSNISYKGIDRKFFPKWEGWVMIDSGSNDLDRLDVLVDEFYYTYFWLKIKGPELECQYLAEMLLSFAVRNGKKKAITKLQRVLNEQQTGLMTQDTVYSTYTKDSETLFLALYAELLEFCISMQKKSDMYSLLNIYYKWLENK